MHVNGKQSGPAGKQDRPLGGAGPLPGSSDLRTRRRRIADYARRVTAGRPHLLVVAATLLSLGLAYVWSYLIRFELSVPDYFTFAMVHTLPFVLFVQCLVFYRVGVFRIMWAYVGIMDLLKILRASALSLLILVGLNAFVLAGGLVPWSVLMLDGLLSFLVVSGLYTLLRVLREAGARDPKGRLLVEPVLIVGAGDTGEALLHEIQCGLSRTTRVAGFLDDAPEKRGRSLRGVPILGRSDQAKEWAQRMGVKTVYFAIPSADGATLRRIVGQLREEKLAVKVLPPLGKLSAIQGLLPQLRDVSIDDLLRRDPIRLDQSGLSAFIKDKIVLVTGAAGSIGSELCRQILQFHPKRLVVLDCAETPLHDIMLELEQGGAERRVSSELADVTDAARVRAVFTKHGPQVVFHAAALKHVPLCESHAREAIRVNVGGTRKVGEAAIRAGTETFIMISTDKAVNPSSVMGATKRVAELVVQELNRRDAKTRFAAVRFGNVLGSNGSVLGIFKAQLARGGPLTVTHPEMRRYFMTIPEAVQLVLQAAVLGMGGEVFELDMGAPVRIVDLAEDLIRLSGLVRDVDVKIEFTGMRPGEKLFEELYLDSELIEPTAHPQVFCLRAGEHRRVEPALLLCMKSLDANAEENDPAGLEARDLLCRILESESGSTKSSQAMEAWSARGEKDLPRASVTFPAG
jgi:FlaA1/EpsC-like NDP-sugar epimerase